jgi:CheY-like chemotaxis protein
MPDSSNRTLETILVVDDDEAAVLETVAKLLESADFRVLAACSGDAAVKLALATRGEIHLVLSAVDLPEMSGPDLGNALKKTRQIFT